MAKNEMTIDVKLNTATLIAGSGAVVAALATVGKTARSVAAAMADAFRIKGYTGYLETVERFGKSLADELLCLQLNFGKLKAAIVDAAAPVASVFVPMLNEALLAAIRFVNGVGAVFSALFGGSKANDALADSAENAEKSQENLAGAVKATGKAVKKSLAGFDELDRLASPSGGGASGSVQPEVTVPDVENSLSPKLQSIVDQIYSILEPLKRIDFSQAIAAFAGLREALKPFTESLFAGLKWAYDKVFVPLAAWTVQNLLPAFLDALAAAAEVLTSVLGALKPLANWLWDSFLQPIAKWTGGVILDALQWLTERLKGVSAWIQQNQPLVEKIAILITGVAGAIGLVNSVLGLWNGISQTAVVAAVALSGAFSVLTSPITLVVAAISAVIGAVILLVRHWDEVKVAAASAWGSIQNVWGGASEWFRQNLLTPLANGFRSMVNGVIGFLNGMISGVVAGINAVIRAINSIRFTLPGWIPGIGGRGVGFNLNTVTAPRIPYLAQGAVLPANRPFLAVVGDQKNGTNVEAPLETIQQALANVLAQRTEEMQTRVTVNFTGDLAQLGRVLKPVIDTENNRRGVSLARGVMG